MRAGRGRFVALAVLLLLVAVAMVLLLLVLPRQAQQGGDRALSETSVDTTTLPATLPFRWAWRLPVVDARLDDADEPLSFLFDTGAPVVFADAIAARHGGEAVGSVTTQAIDGQVEEAPVVAVDELALDEAEFRDVAGIVGWVDPDNPLACVSSNGVLGASLMRDAVWRIDYGAQRIGIHASSEGLELDNAIALGFDAHSDASPSPIVRLLVEGGELSFMLDTGSDAGLAVNPSDLQAAGIKLADDAPSMSLIAAGASGTFAADVRYADVELTLEDADRGLSYPVAASDAIEAGVGNMGNTFLREFVVTIDWPARMLYLQPLASDGSIAPPPDPLSVTTTWQDGELVVGSLVHGGPAEKDGLELGEVLLAVDGQPVKEPSFGAFCASLDESATGLGPQPGFVLTTADGERHRVEVVSGFYD